LEEIGDRVRATLGSRAEHVEEVALISETDYGALAVPIRERLGMIKRQRNVLVGVTIRDPGRSIPKEEANILAQEVYQALHQGTCGYL
jgi:phenylalanyl-tRNA synthetase alpha chain